MKQRAEFWFVGKDQSGKCSLLAPGVVAIAAAAKMGPQVRDDERIGQRPFRAPVSALPTGSRQTCKCGKYTFVMLRIFTAGRQSRPGVVANLESPSTDRRMGAVDSITRMEPDKVAGLIEDIAARLDTPSGTCGRRP